jgi:hypothetical protein
LDAAVEVAQLHIEEEAGGSQSQVGASAMGYRLERLKVKMKINATNIGFREVTKWRIWTNSWRISINSTSWE